MDDCIITLIHTADDPEDDEKTSVYATRYPVGRDEFQAAGVNGYKAEGMFTVWAEEYEDQDAIEIQGDRLTIYRTYGPKSDGKIELYAATRVGNYGC